MLKTRALFPPGGFQFVDPQTGWQAPRNLGFSRAVDAIVKHRKAKDADRQLIEDELDEQNCARLRGIRGGQKYFTETPVPAAPPIQILAPPPPATPPEPEIKTMRFYGQDQP
jgi:hypothetical protein